MSYQSILVHACQSAAAQSRYRLAAQLALAERAHLSGVALSGATAFLCRSAAVTAMALLGPPEDDFLTENARADLAAFAQAARHAGLPTPALHLVDDVPAGGLPLAARYCDLLLIGQTHVPDDLLPDQHALARAVVVHAPCPVLVVPPAWQACGVPLYPLVAWDGSMEASRAVRAALPLLRRAASVEVVAFDPPKHGGDGGAALAALAAYLACHDIEAVTIARGSIHDVGAALLALAQERGRDMLVMGSFGHSRFREIMLGGATRTVLAEATLPVLMAH